MLGPRARHFAMAAVTLRPWAESDAETLHTLYAVRALHDADPRFPLNYTLSQAKEFVRVAEAEHHVAVVAEGGAVVGGTCVVHIIINTH